MVVWYIYIIVVNRWNRSSVTAVACFKTYLRGFIGWFEVWACL